MPSRPLQRVGQPCAAWLQASMPARLLHRKACLFAALLSPLTQNVSHPAELQLCSRHHARLFVAYYSSHPHCKAGEGTCGFPVTSWQHPCTVPGGNAPGQVGVPWTEPGCLSSDHTLPATLTSLPQGQGPSRESHCDVCSLVMLECNEVRPPDDQEVMFRKGWMVERSEETVGLGGWREAREGDGKGGGITAAVLLAPAGPLGGLAGPR